MTGLKSSTFAFIVTLQTPASQPLSAKLLTGLGLGESYTQWVEKYRYIFYIVYSGQCWLEKLTCKHQKNALSKLTQTVEPYTGEIACSHSQFKC